MAAYSLVGIDSNVFSIMGYTLNAMKDCRLSTAEQDAYKKDAMSDDYYHLIMVSNEIVQICNRLKGYDEYNEDEFQSWAEKELYEY